MQPLEQLLRGHVVPGALLQEGAAGAGDRGTSSPGATFLGEELFYPGTNTRKGHV